MNSYSFESYASIYDAFYEDKDYEGECINLIKVAKSITPKLETAVEIGAGSGKFTLELLKTFNYIEVYEISPAMAQICEDRLSGFKNVTINQGDMSQTLDSSLQKKKLVDLVCANFHVFTYFTDYEVDLFVKACANLLRKGGVVAFDFWDLDAVTANPPIAVIKLANHKGSQIIRKTLPVANDLFSKVEVNFEFYSHAEFLFGECHQMYPRRLSDVISVFKESFDFCGSFDIQTGDIYTQKQYGNLVYFRKR